MKLKNIILIVLTIAIFSWGIYTITTFTMFEDENIVVQNINLPNKKYTLKIYYIPSNATNESYIQVRTFENEKEVVLASFKRYNFLNGYKVDDSDSLRLTISDTSQINSKNDVFIKLP